MKILRSIVVLATFLAVSLAHADDADKRKSAEGSDADETSVRKTMQELKTLHADEPAGMNKAELTETLAEKDEVKKNAKEEKRKAKEEKRKEKEERKSDKDKTDKSEAARSKRKDRQ